MTQANGSTAVTIAEQQQPVAKVPLVAGNSPRAIVPTDFEGAWRISTAVVRAGMAPRSLETVEACTVAILHGLEVGLPPMMALQSIAVINGRPSLWGDGALGLIQGSGLLDDQDEHYEGQEGTDAYKAVCILKRKGKSRANVGEFSVADAKKAGLFGKAGPWQGYMKRMLKMRARAFAMRDGFSDVLKGLSVAEEQQDVERARQPDPIDDGGGPPAPANDDGGGPPVPNQGETNAPAEADDGGGPPEPLTEPAKASVTHTDVAQGKPVATVNSTFPGDKPLPKAADDLGLPDFLDRTDELKPAAAKVDDMQDWLDELETEFAACSTMEELSETARGVLHPWEGNVPTDTWNAACDVMDKHVQRLQADG